MTSGCHLGDREITRRRVSTPHSPPRDHTKSNLQLPLAVRRVRRAEAITSFSKKNNKSVTLFKGDFGLYFKQNQRHCENWGTTCLSRSRHHRRPDEFSWDLTGKSHQPCFPWTETIKVEVPTSRTPSSSCFTRLNSSTPTPCQWSLPTTHSADGQ